ncbi:hypothetical protein PU630_10690 [Microbacterium horticulturae]|uniref:DUF5666 domain-containing protein n=1 Tax=Microbacterium horticulturae TaxID=3028316 RepID=A0ABY8BZ71_9MICO|nr:hypothetical protein [Microbacterium sp. KACC 23027]WEG07713.1 hypothetical protein PU630_10690 [Microbacterium sp. KACC 23027]
MRNITFTRRRTALAVSLAGGAALMIALAGCSGASASADPAPSASSPAQGQPNGGDQAGGGGVFGLIAAVDDGTVQVQGDSEQTTVRYTDDTTVRQTSTVKASSIAVGDCVTAITGQDDDTATTVTVTQPADDGTCSTGFGGGGGFGGGARPSGAPTDMPQGQAGGMPTGMPQDGTAPSGAPSGMPSSGQRGGFGGFTTGSVTKASTTSLAVQTTSQDGSTSTKTVTLSSDTTVTATKDATAGAIAEGLCVRATGTADDKGGFDATALTLSDPSDDGTCSTGMGFGGHGGQRPGQDDEGTTNG